MNDDEEAKAGESDFELTKDYIIDNVIQHESEVKEIEVKASLLDTYIINNPVPEIRFSGISHFKTTTPAL